MPSSPKPASRRPCLGRPLSAHVWLAAALWSTGLMLAAPSTPRPDGETAPSTRRAALPPLLGTDYPRAFFFRGAEGPPAQPQTTYEDWADDFGRLMGIMGKCLDEEVLGRERRNPEFFSRFKRERPDQVVLLHFNGNARDPRHGTERYFAGHWIYREATPILADVPAQAGESIVRVASTDDFQVNTGRYQTANDDIALFGVTAEGRHDWTHCEQVRLLAVDRTAKTIRVQRGCYGTQPRSFRAGAARAAAHAVEGPWGKPNHLLWYYNYATHCPRDAEGKTCADRLVDDLAAWLGPDGRLAAFDGVEFDVLYHETLGDTDGDGKSDHGLRDGRNHYGIGVVEFIRQLRTRLGPQRILQADGALGPGGRRSQRAFGLLNGIESEGFPNLDDWEFRDWSGGLNRHAFWQANAHPPALNYINHKWTQAIPGQPGEHTNPTVPYARHRLSFAAAQFTDAAICYSFAPPREKGRFGIWDELQAGTDQHLGWLGHPEGPARHLATTTPNLLSAAPRTAGADLARYLAGAMVTRVTAEGLVLTPPEASRERTTFTLRQLPAAGPELVVLLTMRGAPRQGYPSAMARLVDVELSSGIVNLLGGPPPEVGLGLRGAAEQPLRSETGARAQLQGHVVVGGKSLPALSIHPPYKQGKGYVYWQRDVDLPEAAELRFQLGMSERAPARSDGVWFKVFVAALVGGRPGPFQPVFERATKEYAWLPCAVDLRRYAGQRVRLKFVADCGPRDHATTDQGYWGDVKIVRAGQDETTLTAVTHAMTWLNERDFTSVFYFRDVRSPTVDLTLTVEGPEAVTLVNAAVHAHPDAMWRSFENGIVLANPSRQPYTFHLAALTPGRHYRRLQATPRQDPQTNNGEAVPDTVTLGERDALFLRRVP